LLVRDYAGLVWVCAAPSADLAPPLVDLGPLADLSPISLVTKPVRSSFDQVVLGLVDPAHVPLVHQSWWWRRSGRPRQIKTKIYAATEYGFTARASAPRKSGPVYAIFGRDLEVNIEFRLPGVRIERIEAGQRKFYNMTCVTPVTNRQCMLLNVIYSNVGALRFLKPAADRVAGIFLQQDRRLLEMLEDASPYFRSMIFVGDPDTPARWYFMLKRELADAQARSRPFRNPVSGGTLRWQT
jgi:phenylpropionate dioxygenase-like ring-hydroxylating dioxygenase large terminal subunit